MLTSQQYAAFAAALSQREVMLRTTACAYRRAHELPGWYSALAAVTPLSAWTVGDDQVASIRHASNWAPAPRWYATTPNP